MFKFNEKTIKDKIVKPIKKNVIKDKGYPKQLKAKDTNGKAHKLSKKEYFGILKQRNLFRHNKGRFPNYVTYTGKAKEPVIINYQDNSHTCACASFNMALQGFGDYIDEMKIAKAFNTGQYGTSPSDMINGAKKFGYEVKPINRSINGIRKAKDKGHGIIAHIDTIKAPCLSYRNNYGHFIYISRITKANNYRVFDPTKGVMSVKPSCIDNAMLNRKINYYSVKPIII